MTVQEASQAIDQMDVDTQVVRELSRSGARGRSARPGNRRCGVCGKAGHNARTCQVVIEISGEEYKKCGAYLSAAHAYQTQIANITLPIGIKNVTYLAIGNRGRAVANIRSYYARRQSWHLHKQTYLACDSFDKEIVDSVQDQRGIPRVTRLVPVLSIYYSLGHVTAKKFSAKGLPNWSAMLTPVALHPSYGYDYFERHWKNAMDKPQWYSDMQSAVGSLFDEYVRQAEVETQAQAGLLEDEANEIEADVNDYSSFGNRSIRSLNTQRRKVKAVSDLDLFQTRPIYPQDLDVANPLEWWNRHQLEYPVLYRTIEWR
ncbi:Uncharacterized protein HZ326_23884 [Fusarium oxysporum f. sp. albedinis]|nr:Uncharacterized protein HZ326_23884 [Fusarium oxysporum f. sp. albedinis]